MRRVDNLMEILRQLLIKLGVNAIPLGGFLFGGWSGATALAIYWFENLIGSLLIVLRIAIHRRLTHKRGHWSAQLGVSVTAGTGATPKEQAFGSFLTEFLTTSLAFTFVHGLFLGAVLVIIVHALPDPAGFRAGALGVTAFLLFDFAIDLIKLKERPFAWIKRIAQVELGRIVLVQLAIIGGVFLAACIQEGNVFFLPYAFLKLLADLGSMFGRGDVSKPAPRWLVGLMNRIKPGGDFGADMAADQAKELARAAEDEQVMQ